MIKVKCFGVAKEIVEKEFYEISRDQISIKELREELQAAFPEFSKINGYMVAVNQEYATDDMSVTSNDEVAIIPPVSGG